MRAAIAAIVMLPLAAHGGAFTDVVVQGAKHLPRTSSFTGVSHVIYLNNCLPNGCTVMPGFDDSRTDHSSIPQNQSHLAAYPWSTDSWNQLVQCVRDMYAPFDVQITDVDPGNAPHFELMVGGNSTDVGVQGAGGVAPFVPCDGNLEDNVISFVFAAETSDPDYLCWAAAQETSHVFGLDHELLATDPMTYLYPPIKKPGFQNMAVSCGEDQPRQCWCGNDKQNSAQYLLDTLGPAHLDPATMTITTPADGAWVKPGFPIRAAVISQLSVRTGELQIDGQTATSISQPPLAFNAPATVVGGDHAITVVATDSANRQLTAAVSVHVVASCAGGASCDGGFACLGGYCLPNANTAGGLGATCTDGASCITGACGTDGTNHICTAPCDDGNICPAGFQCISAGSENVCWPQPASSGCAASSNTSPLLALLGLGALVSLVRTRASRRRP